MARAQTRRRGGWRAAGSCRSRPEVIAAIHEAASKINHAELKGKQVHGVLLGTYIQAGSVKVPHSVDTNGASAEAFVCMNTGGGVAPPGEKVDGNQAQHFYVRIGDATYGPLPFNNPLAKT
jgi:hypothetical protein